MKNEIQQAHDLYCQLTGQTLSLGFERERLWFDLLKTGVTLEDIRRVVGYLQREIREGRRNVGALKLSNLLQVDRFEEDLQISRVRLKLASPQVATLHPLLTSHDSTSSQEDQAAHHRALEILRQFRKSLL